MIRPVKASETRSLRHNVLRPNQPVDFCMYPGDEDEDTFHLGFFLEDDLIGVGSVFNEPRPGTSDSYSWRLRGLAITPGQRSEGHGGCLLRHCLRGVAQRGGRLVWCNIPSPALDFFLRHGFNVLGPEFDVATVGPHFMMRKRIDSRDTALLGAGDTIPSF
jgi:predicted GNAT family N-acyltransferase